LSGFALLVGCAAAPTTEPDPEPDTDSNLEPRGEVAQAVVGNTPINIRCVVGAAASTNVCPPARRGQAISLTALTSFTNPEAEHHWTVVYKGTTYNLIQERARGDLASNAGIRTQGCGYLDQFCTLIADNRCSDSAGLTLFASDQVFDRFKNQELGKAETTP